MKERVLSPAIQSFKDVIINDSQKIRSNPGGVTPGVLLKNIHQFTQLGWQFMAIHVRLVRSVLADA
jgi:hypothetical protein